MYVSVSLQINIKKQDKSTNADVLTNYGVTNFQGVWEEKQRWKTGERCSPTQPTHIKPSAISIGFISQPNSCFEVEALKQLVRFHVIRHTK